MSFPRYPKYKPSGVEWLGDVPEHRDVCALNYRFEVALGKMLDEKQISGNHLAPYLRNTDVQWGRVHTDDLPQMDFEGDDSIRYSLKAGDLLVCEGGKSAELPFGMPRLRKLLSKSAPSHSDKRYGA